MIHIKVAAREARDVASHTMEMPMNVRALTAKAPLEAITLHSGAGALVLWFAVLWNEAPRWAYGAICSEAQGLIGHCPLCLPAAALTVISLAGGLRLLQQCGRD